MDSASIAESESSDGGLKPIPREIAFLETFFYTIAQFQFDRAQEFTEKEKEMFKPALNSNWMSLLNLLITLTYAERNYFTMAFIEKKLFKQTIRPLYTSLFAELDKQEELKKTCTVHGLEILSVDLSKQIKHFVSARIKMIEFYEFMAKSGWNHTLNTLEIVKSINDISLEFSKEFHHPILDPLKSSFSYEVDIISTLFQIEHSLAEWNFLESLLLLRECHAKLNFWCTLSPSTSVKEQLLSTFSYKSLFGRKKQSGDTPFLFHWLYNLYANLFSKFSLYFHTALSAQTPAVDMKTLLTKFSIDFVGKLTTFQKKTDAVNVSLVLDTNTKKDIFRGHGYHLDNTIRDKPTGMNSYPSVINIPSEVRPKEHWPNVISIINDQGELLAVRDKVVYFFDEKLDSSYFFIKVDVRMTLAVIYNGKKKERDNYIQSFMTEMRALMNHDKLYHVLKPGQAKTF